LKRRIFFAFKLRLDKLTLPDNTKKEILGKNCQQLFLTISPFFDARKKHKDLLVRSSL
jgi:hypothetical protein